MHQQLFACVYPAAGLCWFVAVVSHTSWFFAQFCCRGWGGQTPPKDTKHNATRVQDTRESKL